MQGRCTAGLALGNGALLIAVPLFAGFRLDSQFQLSRILSEHCKNLSAAPTPCEQNPS